MKKIIFGIVAVIMTLGMLVSCNFTSDIGSEGILLKSVLEGMGNFQCSIIIYSFLFYQMFFRAFGRLSAFFAKLAAERGYAPLRFLLLFILRFPQDQEYRPFSEEVSV